MTTSLVLKDKYRLPNTRPRGYAAGLWMTVAILSGILVFNALSGCSSARPDQDRAAIFARVARVGCAVLASEGSSQEVAQARLAIAAIETAVGNSTDPLPEFSVFPRRVMPYVVVLIEETRGLTPVEYQAAVLAFTTGCKSVLGSPVAPVAALGPGGNCRRVPVHKG